MKTLLIPIDFSQTSENTIDFALKWAKAYDYERVVMLRSFYDTMFDQLISSADYMHVNSDYLTKERTEALDKLNEILSDVKTKVDGNLKVELVVSELPLLRAILATIDEDNAELIVLGSDNYNLSSNSTIAANAISIARISPVRVLIVPSNYHYKPVKQALVPVNFNTLETLGKLDNYHGASVKWREKKLLVLNVDPKERYLQPNEQFNLAENALHEYLKNFEHEVFYSNNKNIISGILDFTKQRDIQLIVALPGKHSFLYSLTHKNISEAIYRNAQEPVLILK